MTDDPSWTNSPAYQGARAGVHRIALSMQPAQLMEQAEELFEDGFRLGLVDGLFLLACAACQQYQGGQACACEHGAKYLLNCHKSPSTLVCGLRRTARAEIFFVVGCPRAVDCCLRREERFKIETL